MLKRSNQWLIVLISIMVSLLIDMMLFPFADTTEPRYAEIARLMAKTGDWVTPWFEPGVPFCGVSLRYRSGRRLQQSSY